jgi:hypothetical protein
MVRVFDRGAELLVDCEPSSAEGFVAMIRKFVNPRTAKYTVISETTSCLAVHGAQAAKLLAPLVPVDHAALDALPTLGLWRSEDGSLEIIRSDELSVAGFEVIASLERIAALRSALQAQGLQEADAALIETLRIERGLPRFGVEMDDSAGSEPRRAWCHLVHEGLLHRARSGSPHSLPGAREPAFALATLGAGPADWRHHCRCRGQGSWRRTLEHSERGARTSRDRYAAARVGSRQRRACAF